MRFMSSTVSSCILIYSPPSHFSYFTSFPCVFLTFVIFLPRLVSLGPRYPSLHSVFSPCVPFSQRQFVFVARVKRSSLFFGLLILAGSLTDRFASLDCFAGFDPCLSCSASESLHVGPISISFDLFRTLKKNKKKIYKKKIKKKQNKTKNVRFNERHKIAFHVRKGVGGSNMFGESPFVFQQNVPVHKA